MGVALAVEAVIEAPKRLDNGLLRGIEEAVSKFSSAQTEQVIAIAGSTRFGIYETDFGWGSRGWFGFEQGGNGLFLLRCLLIVTKPPEAVKLLKLQYGLRTQCITANVIIVMQNDHLIIDM
ncbi:hypothetical protein HHK36_024449 [Tetracentron sinense]|uniref:Uncharacterized protein n=1 Tax=Tetracentron sinense TaxID=13715 RepID=A0A834YKX0_TETSI|nr:hypothetical protein HHK36_024449 [Tetracentron sinense]